MNRERTILAAFAQGWVMLGVAHGMPLDEICRRSGFQPQDIADRERHMPYAWYSALRRTVIAGLHHLDVGIELGRLGSLDHLGYLGLALQYCETPRDALRLVIRYRTFVDSEAAELGPRLEEHGDTVDWVVPRTADDPPEAIEAQFIGSVSLLRSLTGAAATPRAVNFTHSREPLRDRLEALLGTQVSFGCADNRLSYRSVDLDRRLLRADATVRKHLEAELDRLEEQIREPFVEIVRRAIVAQLSTGELSQQRIAARLGLSTRTMQRRLNDLGASYHDLVSEVRWAVGSRLMRDASMAIYQVAFALGYDDIGSFSRAWKRWTDLSPRAFRERLARGEPHASPPDLATRRSTRRRQ